MLWCWWECRVKMPGRGLTTEVKLVMHVGRLRKKVGSIWEEKHQQHRNQKLLSLACSSVVEHLLSMWDAIGKSSHNVKQTNK